MFQWWNKTKEKIFITKVPSYGNTIFYSLGFLALTCLTLLIASGLTMIVSGPSWWLTNPWGVVVRSIHLWSAQAFVLIILLHFLVVFSTSAFRTPRKLTWIVGVIALLVVLTEAEFGYGLRGDFSSQYRALQGADFYNGAFIGKFISTLNYAQVYGLHVMYIPIFLVTVVCIHYALVKIRGIAKPYRKNVSYTMVSADHRRLFLRGIILGSVILFLALLFPSPFIAPVTITQVAKESPALMAQTLLSEFTHTSDTATYLDSIDPYTYDTRAIYVSIPYASYASTHGIDDLALFEEANTTLQQKYITQASNYFQNNGSLVVQQNNNPLIPVISALVLMGQQGTYTPILNSENIAIQPTYSLRFLADTGVLDAEATQLHITTDQWGMMREEKGFIPPGAWWLAPLGFLDHTILANDQNGDRDGAEILGFCALLLILFPYIPYINRIPEWLPFARIIWKGK